LRPDIHGQPGGVDRLAAWLFNAIKRQLTLACRKPARLLTTKTSPALASWVAAQRAPNDADTIWAACYDRLPGDQDTSNAVARLILPALRNQFCIGYELPPYLIDLLDQHDIPWIDIRIHPIRFLDDLLFAVRASDPRTQQFLLDHSVTEAHIQITAGLRDAMCQFISHASVPPDPLLILGQRRFDSSQISKGVFYDAMNHTTEIAAICARHPAVILKPHPLDTEHSLLTAAASLGANVIGLVNDNLYRLLALPEISAILSVSSSAAHEAIYFGKTIYTLMPLPLRLAWRGDPIRADHHAALDDALLSIDIWRTILAPHTAVTPADGVRLPPKPNRLRLALDSFWAFNEIDTDRLPRPKPLG
jgi:hypothetical protein